MGSVDTRRDVQRRTLRLNSIDDALAEVEKIAAADDAGTLRAYGNWTAGQAMAHIAAWIEYGYVGYPTGPPPWFVRWFLRLQLKKFLRDGMTAGIRIPGSPEGTYGVDKMETQAAADRLKNALLKLKRGEPIQFHSPAFGQMSDKDRVRLNLRHAELHLSFLDYAS